MAQNFEIRECTTLDEMSQCVALQRAVFALPELEISPVRHFVVTKNAGGFVLGAFRGDQVVGFVLSVPAFLRGEKAYYSHMTAVDPEFQAMGLGAKLKWQQRRTAIDKGIGYIKWTFEPVKARNAYFNLEKLGAVVREYEPNFYGTDYSSGADPIGLSSDRLFAEWDLKDDRVRSLAGGSNVTSIGEIKAEIVIPSDWSCLVARDPQRAIAEQSRIRQEFELAFSNGLVCLGFRRDDEAPRYLLF